MTLNEIIQVAASAYPDEWILRHWDAKRQCAVEDTSSGDSLAALIAWELYETYDPDLCDDDQIETAVRVTRNAADELRAVATALENLKKRKRGA